MNTGWTQIIFAGVLLVIVMAVQAQNPRGARRILRFGTLLLTVLSLLQIFLIERNGIIELVSLSWQHVLAFVGAGVFLLLALISYWQQKMRNPRHLSPAPDLSLPQRRVYWDSGGNEFYVMGLFRPIVVLGQKSWSQLSQTQRSLVLAHEEAHLLGRDLAWRFFLFISGAVHILNPTFFFFRRRLALLDELVADEWALRKTGAREKDLVQMLVSLADQDSFSGLSWRQYFGSSMTLVRAQCLERRRQRRPGAGVIGKVKWQVLAPLAFVVWSLMTISVSALENRWVRAEAQADGWHWVRSEINLGIVNNFLATSAGQDLRCETHQE